MIRIGRYTVDKNGVKSIPQYRGFTTILVDYNSEYAELAPWNMKNEKGQYIENIIQFSKVYEEVYEIKQMLSPNDKRVIWKWDNEIHIKDNKIQKEYIRWYNSGVNNKEPVLNPNGIRNKGKNKYVIMHRKDGSFTKPIDNISARRKLFIPLYSKYVKELSLFKELKRRVIENGENLLIVEKDGPDYNLLNHYIKKYNVSPRFMHNKTIIVDKESMDILIEDKETTFGFGYILGMTLLDKDKKWNNNIVYDNVNIKGVKTFKVKNNKKKKRKIYLI